MAEAKSIARAKDGCRISYRIYPNPGKPHLTLIHSLALSGAMWSEVAKELSGSAEILIYDCRGHGHSERRSGPYSVELFADDLAALLDSVGWSSTNVAGCSMGGCVAQAFAGMYPDRVRALALIDTTAWYGLGAPKDWRERAPTPSTKGFQGLSAFQATRWVSEAFREAHPDVIRKNLNVFLANDIDCYTATCEMLGDADLRHYQSAMRMPTSVIVGEEDYATPVAMSEQIQKAMPDATLSVLKNVRHLTPIERPAVIAQEILALMER